MSAKFAGHWRSKNDAALAEWQWRLSSPFAIKLCSKDNFTLKLKLSFDLTSETPIGSSLNLVRCLLRAFVDNHASRGFISIQIQISTAAGTANFNCYKSFFNFGMNYSFAFPDFCFLNTLKKVNDRGSQPMYLTTHTEKRQKSKVCSHSHIFSEICSAIKKKVTLLAARMLAQCQHSSLL